jgi:hypothetical protein
MLLNAYRLLVGIPKGNIPFGFHRHEGEVKY